MLDTEGKQQFWRWGDFFASTTFSGSQLMSRPPQPYSTCNLPMAWRVLRRSVHAFVWVITHPHQGATQNAMPWGASQISLLPLSHTRPTKPLWATCCVFHRCKKHFLHNSVWGETRVNGLGRLPGVLEARWACPRRETRAGLSGSPTPDRSRVPAADLSAAPGPRATLCRATQHLDQEAAVACSVMFLKAHFPVQGGSRWKAEPLKGRYFERPHRRSSNKKARGAGIHPKLSNWPSLLIWDLMPPNQTNSKSHLLNFSVQFFFSTNESSGIGLLTALLTSLAAQIKSEWFVSFYYTMGHMSPK